jgi:hypothetical protein
MAAGPLAFALDVAGICYSNKHALDGFIATYALPAVLPPLPDAAAQAARLVEVGRWHEVEGGWLIHDIGDYQPSAASTKELSRKRAEAGRLGGKRSGEARRSTGEAKPKQVLREGLNPGPSRPVPTPRSTPSPTDVDREGAERQFLEEFWPAYPARDGKKVGKKAALVEWHKLTEAERARALIGARHLAASGRLPKDPERFLRRDKGGARPFEEWQTPATPNGAAPGAGGAEEPRSYSTPNGQLPTPSRSRAR